MTDPTEYEPPPDGEARGDITRLPHRLRGRFRLTDVLRTPTRPGQAAVFRVLRTGRGAGAEETPAGGGGDHVVKWYDRAMPPDPDVLRLLRTRRLPHTTRLTETGDADGHPYEIAPSFGDTDLDQYRRARPGPAPAPLVRAVVEQLHAALGAFHAHGFVHRDVTPANIVLGSLDPADPRLTLVDFSLAARPSGPGARARPPGAAATSPWPAEHAPWGGTYPYLSPQAALHHQLIHPSDDWWSLGMVVAELAGGAHPVRHTHGAYVPIELSARPPELSLVTDPRLHALCRGLLTRDPDTRWSGDQVAEWLAGGSPPIDLRDWPPPERATGGTVTPFPFMGREFTDPAELGMAFDTYWGQTERALGRRRTRHAFTDWLRQFAAAPRYDEAAREELDALLRLLERAPGPTTQVRLISWLAPPLEPTFRGEAVDPALGLADLAARAEEDDDERARSVVEDLARDAILPLLEARPGGHGLTAVDTAWREALRRWRPAVDALGAEFPTLRRRLREHPELTATDARLTARLLHTAAAPERCRALLDGRATRRLRRLPEPVPWFGWLVADRRDPLRLLLADQLAGLAEEEAWAARTERRAREEGRRRDADYLHAVAWLNVQQRPVALGWAAAGAVAVTFPWIFLIGVSDVAGLATQESVVLAWAGAVPGLAAILALELLAAFRIGALAYHPRRSLAGRLVEGGAPLARLARRNRLLGAVALAGVVALLVTTVTAVAWLWPLATVLAVGWWTWRRLDAPSTTALGRPR
ncbi:protein kinase domain-containing protein [Streptomyces profundus]|uniref:protein kinase domain-containing protein n=1 Tax=Streptomyces profundus TaxID=2867410 RepID=UPI001D169DED|nr:serine/threonine protein kinase [Streptomyces sp. MA3_2.13]UED87453.1 serine/threonine protein kinase [Streptomyces sp. MA3_2.13]